LARAESGDCALVATGDAVDVLLSVSERGGNDGRGAEFRDACRCVSVRLSAVHVIARASPRTKRRVVGCLRGVCGHTVLMCGDGVNDVGAMKAADVSVAMLTGYGSEDSSDADDNIDHEDEMRRERFRRRVLKNKQGYAAMAKTTESSLEKIVASHGIGDSPVAKQARVKRKIDAALKGITDASSGGQGDVAYSFGDIKILLKSIWKALMEERQRDKALRKGGGAAARVLAEDNRLRKSVLRSCGKDPFVKNSGHEHDNGDRESDTTIKPGEACLASAFTFLRPCIDGADVLIRAGISAAACSLSLHQVIALNSLMSCFNLATLYRDGFRYGRYMWNAELAFIMASDRASYQASCTSRPRIAKIRPDASVFDGPNLLSVVSQAVIHLLVLTGGADAAAAYERMSLSEKVRRGLRIRWNGGLNGSSQISCTEKFVTPTMNSMEGDTGGSLLGRPKFRPNQITNAVFLLSIFQNAVVTVVNHKGSPFYEDILENRSLCLALGGAMIFCLACVAESVPWLNSLLELAPMSSWKMKFNLLLLFLIDFVGCFVVDRLSLIFLNPSLWEKKLSTTYASTGDAASEEDDFLKSEVGANIRLVVGFGLLALILILDTIR